MKQQTSVNIALDISLVKDIGGSDQLQEHYYVPAVCNCSYYFPNQCCVYILLGETRG